MTHVLINGELLGAAAAKVSIDDRGFRFGDGLFETILIHGGLPYLWAYHMQRLEEGLAALHIPCATQNLLPQALTLLKTSGISQGTLRIQVSRGEGSQGYLPLPSITPTVVMQAQLSAQEISTDPVTLWLSRYEKISPRALPTRCKTAQGLNATLARMEAQENGCDEALQQGPGGMIAETSSANLFWLKDGVLHTPSLDSGALAGVTRRRLIELSPFPVKEDSYPLEALHEAEAVVLTNSRQGTTAVHRLLPNGWNWNGKALANRLNIIRNQDIDSDTNRLRELLA